MRKLTLQQRYFVFKGPPQRCLPVGLFERLIARFMELSQCTLVWAKGVLVVKDEEKALLLNSPEENQITITVYGNKIERMWNMLNFQINDLSQQWYTCKPDIVVPCQHCVLGGSKGNSLLAIYNIYFINESCCCCPNLQDLFLSLVPYKFLVQECEQAMALGKSPLHSFHYTFVLDYTHTLILLFLYRKDVRTVSTLSKQPSCCYLFESACARHFTCRP